MPIKLARSENKLHLVLFSKDRAMQTDALLQGLSMYGQEVFDIITVIHTASSPAFEETNLQLISDYPELEFVKNTGFEETTKQVMSTPSKYTLFLVDDDLLYRKISAAPIKFFLDNPEVVCFNLRVGLNLTGRCYMTGQDGSPGAYTLSNGPGDGGKYIVWNWQGQRSDWGFPHGASCQAYRTEYIRELLTNFNFLTPIHIEGGIDEQRHKAPPLMAAYDHSAVVNVPANRVQDYAPTAFGGTYRFMADDLNNLYLEGKRIDLSAMNLDIVQAHQELKYEFK